MRTMSFSPSTSSKLPEKKTSTEKTKDSQVDFFLNDFTETGSVRVGKDYQATMPEYIGDGEPCTGDDKSVLLWSPPENLSEEDYYEYTAIAGKEYKYSLEQALGFLQWHEHDVKRAIKELAQYVPVSDDWSVEDVLVFEQAFAFNGKCFNRIQQMLPNKTMASLVKFYYSWKKRTGKDMPSHVDYCDKRRPLSDDDEFESSSETSEKRRKFVSDTRHCRNCCAYSTQMYSSPHGKLCNTCFVYFRRTGSLREVASKKRISQELIEESDSDPDNQRNHKAPRNMNLNLNDFSTMVEKSQQNVQHQSTSSSNSDFNCPPSSSTSFPYEYAKDKDNENAIREIRSYRERAAKNRFTLAQMRKCLLGAKDINFYRLPPKPKQLKTLPKWDQHEILLVLQGFRMFGKNFHSISELMGTKTIDLVRTFYNNNRNKYGIDSLIHELEQQKKDEKVAKDRNVVVLSDEEKDTEIVMIDD